MIEPTPEEVAGWVERSTTEQGIPVRVSDRRVAEAVAALLGAGREQVRSEPPDRRESVRVEGVTALDGGIHHHVIEDGADDGVLAGEWEIGPSIP